MESNVRITITERSSNSKKLKHLNFKKSSNKDEENELVSKRFTDDFQNANVKMLL
jgi:hypothetical protein